MFAWFAVIFTIPPKTMEFLFRIFRKTGFVRSAEWVKTSSRKHERSPVSREREKKTHESKKGSWI
jgi:hypothetical protein